MSQKIFFKPNKNYIIELPVLDGSKMEYRGAVNLREFYEELYNFFINNPHTKINDFLGTKSEKEKGKFFENQQKKGEFVDNKEFKNRTGGIFEKKFVWAKGDGTVDFELLWEAKGEIPNSPYGWFEIKIDLVNRTIRDIDIEKNGKKIKMQDGTWEFRNKITYKNKIQKEYLNKIPFVKNSDFLKHLYLSNIYFKTIEYEYLWCFKKVKAPLIQFIESYFTS